MAAALGGLLPGVCAVLMVIAVASAASSEASSVVVGLAKCADCTRKNMKAEAAFKVQVSHAINKYVPIPSTCIPLAKYITLVVQNL
ncbi:unnamed protein product [Miscanthus lutarioriparius]|uniref:Uncharacterized protein n=1 Tax=Miscanthus lutarioriparius TaxID=422564 RepID=A0A811R9N7_9POAL|nr:unnamed protein product [Miscanthus lutarioriparius]CAD6254685.1 unnamed protein product [Miscanthus lutarioriparius]CAD6266743.1 unnamed protein product [Miscanthus lutarioriparius]